MKYEGEGAIDPTQKKILSKSLALLGLNTHTKISMFYVNVNENDIQCTKCLLKMLFKIWCSKPKYFEVTEP